MEIKKNNRFIQNLNKDDILLICIGIAMVWSLSAAIVSTTEFVQPKGIMLLNISLIMVGLKLIFLNRYTLFFTISIIFTFVTIIFIDSIINEHTILYDINSFVVSVLLYLNGLTPYRHTYEIAIIIFLNIAFSLFVFIFGYIWFSFIALFTLGTLLFAIILTSGFFHFDISFYVFIVCIITYLVRHLNYRSFGKRPIVLLYTLLFSFLSVLVAGLLPTPEEGFSDHVADNFFIRPLNFVNNTIHDTFRPKYFSLAQTGFGTGNVRRLGGNVTANYNIVMRVHSYEPTLYLTGAIMDTYTGYSWVNTFENNYQLTFDGLNIALLEQKTSLFNIWNQGTYSIIGDNPYLYFAQKYFNFNNYDYYNMVTIREIIDLPFLERSLTVNTLNQSTFSVFHNGIIVRESLPLYNNSLLHNLNGTIVTQNIIPRYTNYAFIYAYIHPSINTTAIKMASYNGILQSVRNNLDNNFSLLMNGISISYKSLLDDYLIPRSLWIREVYTQLPEHFPQRVVDLAYYVTYGATNNYEKARLLESFLRRFEYTLEPGHFPPDRDFVDYFLFDLQKGYCTYYASAFVTMARALGIPTRYVEGFIAVLEPGSYIYIRNRQGHAWAEVYFEGFGWHRFDPTPPSDTFGAIFASLETSNFELEVRYNEWENTMMWWDEEMHLLAGMGNNIEGFDAGYTPIIEFEPEVTEDNTAQIRGSMYLSILIVSTLVAFLVAFRVMYIVRKHYLIRGKNNKEAVLLHFLSILKYMEFFNYEKDESETVMQFAKRANNFAFEIKNKKLNMVDVSAIFLKANYSKHSITKEEREIVEAALVSMDERMKSYVNKYRYFIMKYIFATV